jgi:hypothetical protein
LFVCLLVLMLGIEPMASSMLHMCSSTEALPSVFGQVPNLALRPWDHSDSLDWNHLWGTYLLTALARERNLTHRPQFLIACHQYYLLILISFSLTSWEGCHIGMLHKDAAVIYYTTMYELLSFTFYFIRLIGAYVFGIYIVNKFIFL